MFAYKAIFLFVLSAILIPLLFVTRELFLLGIFIGVFILSQVVLLYLFYQQKKLGVKEWYAFWSAIASLIFMLILLLIGRKATIEFLGLVLFLDYFIGLIILLFRDRIITILKQTSKKTLTDKDFKAFRNKDELHKLIDAFELDTLPKAKLFDTEKADIHLKEVKPDKEEETKEKEETKRREEKAKEEEKKEIRKEEQPPEFRAASFFEHMKEKEEKEKEEEPRIRELKEAPRIDFEKVKQDLERIDTNVKTISEKIRRISERAIQEGMKRKSEEKEKRKAKQKKLKKKEMKVYASKTGNKYHYDKNCLGLKRVSKKNLVTYTNSREARRKGLKACGICK